MATLIAVDGHSLNFGLQKIAHAQNGGKRSRFRIDHLRLAELLARPELLEKVSLKFYTDDQKSEIDGRPMGRVVKFFSNKGYGFIVGTDGQSYFFHHNEIINKKLLCERNEDRYPHPSSPEFCDRIFNKVVTFNSVLGDDNRLKAEEVRLELGTKVLDRYYQLRREPFLQMLEESGYKLIRCRPSRHSGKSKNIDCRIILDALCELDKGDRLVLLSDDPVFIDLIERLLESETDVTVATFKVARSDEIREATEKAGGKVLLLDDCLDAIQLEFDDEFEEDMETSIEESTSEESTPVTV